MAATNERYKNDIHDISLAVANYSKAYTDKKIEDLKWELGTYDLGVDTINGTTMLLPSPANTIQATMVEIDGASEVSENLLTLQDVAARTINGITFKAENGVFIVNGTASATFFQTVATSIVLSAGSYYLSSFNNYNVNDFRIGLFNSLENVVVNPNTSFTISQSTTYNLVVHCRTVGITLNNEKFYMMLVKGSTAPTTFKPHFEGIHNLELSGLVVKNSDDEVMQTLPIDLTSIEDSGGNKLFADGSIKSAGTAKDSISPTKAIKKMGIVDLGSLNYGTSYGTNLFNVSLSGVKGLTINLLSAIYTPTDNWNTFTNNDLMAHISSGGMLILHNNSYTTAAAFKTAMSGVYLVYELATPIEADINLSQLVKFEAHSNGSITLVNTNNQDTTSTFKYLKEVAK